MSDSREDVAATPGLVAPAGRSFVLRFLLLSLAALGAGWAILVAPAQVQGEAIAATGRQIAQGATFQPEVLEPLMAPERAAFLGSPCVPSAQQGRQWIALKLSDLADQDSSNLARIDSSLERLGQTARTALACSPYDGFAWLMLYWSHGRQTGFHGKTLDFLEMSYATAPREGALALYRNPRAILAFRNLPSRLQAQVLDEWRLLVGARLYETAAVGLTQIAEADREQLLAQRDRIDPDIWENFAVYLYRNGSDIVLPGTKPPPQRPWR